MADLPYMKFYPADWLADCDVLSVSARGAWQTFLCKAWLARSASITLKVPQWCRVFGATNAEQAERIIAEIEECEVGDLIREDDGRVTLISRRIERDLAAMGATQKKRSEAARLAAESRWNAERMRGGCGTHNEGNADAMRKDAIPEGRSQKSSESIDSESLPHGEAFAKAWKRWVKHRSEIRKPLKPTQTDSQLRNLASMSEPEACAMIEHTIEKGWQGLRSPEPAKSEPTSRRRAEYPQPELELP